LLHIADSIYNTGSGWATWQYPIERLCGMLLPLVCSMQHPYTILQNQITMWTQFYTFNINLIYIKSLLVQIQKNHQKAMFLLLIVLKKFYIHYHTNIA
ncbi:hypothetical protein RhiirA5_453123, partial [Rhizophagus irregularis]